MEKRREASPLCTSAERVENKLHWICIKMYEVLEEKRQMRTLSFVMTTAKLREQLYSTLLIDESRAFSLWHLSSVHTHAPSIRTRTCKCWHAFAHAWKCHLTLGRMVAEHAVSYNHMSDREKVKVRGWRYNVETNQINQKHPLIVSFDPLLSLMCSTSSRDIIHVRPIDVIAHF